MPELPEVEAIRLSLEPWLVGKRFVRVEVSQPRLRWPVSSDLVKRLSGASVASLLRRGKYLLINTNHGVLIVHFGMSGSLRLLPADSPLGPHDHAVFALDSGQQLVFHDPRRFGALIWTEAAAEAHPFLSRLGAEPFDPKCGHLLWQAARTRRQAVKCLLMEQRILAGIGNIYANEALFLAGIHPAQPAYRLSQKQYQDVAACVREVLTSAIHQGGTTLRDFSNALGQRGYFQLTLQVYGRAGLPCLRCAEPIHKSFIGQRATYYCPHCQR